MVEEHTSSNFRKILSDNLESICEDRSMDMQVPKDKGTAFQIWCADLLTNAYRGVETEPGDAILTTGDLLIDVFLEDTVSEKMILAQCKCTSLQKKSKPMPDGQVDGFIARHKHLLNPEWIQKHGSQRAFQLLSDYGRYIKNGWSATYYFMTMDEAGNRIKDVVASKNEEYTQEGISVRCELLDRNQLAEFWSRTVSLEGEVGVHISDVRLPADHYFLLHDPYPTVVAAVKANWLRDIYKKGGVRERIFALNIRDWLGKRNQINRQIVETINEEPGHFFYYNNGVSAVCTKLDVNKRTNDLTVENFQIINGAQTVGAIVDAIPQDCAWVLLRITQSSTSKSQKKIINDNIIKYNNTQNVVKVADFCANDPIQKWLETEFMKHKQRKHLPAITYQRRRGVSKKTKGRCVLKLEDLGKIRYAFEYEPTLVINSPKDLFTSKVAHSEGAYEKAFGEHKALEPQWPAALFDRCLLAIAFFRHTEERIKICKNEDDSLLFLNQLKYHFVAMAGEVCRGLGDDVIHTMVNQEKTFLKEFDQIWRAASYVVKSEWKRNNKADSPMTLRTFARNKSIWEQIRESFHEFLSASQIHTQA